jgi:hypothetical protein
MWLETYRPSPLKLQGSRPLFRARTSNTPRTSTPACLRSMQHSIESNKEADSILRSPEANRGQSHPIRHSEATSNARRPMRSRAHTCER